LGIFFAGDRKKIKAPKIRAERPINTAVSAAARRASLTRGFRRRTVFFRFFNAPAGAVFFEAFFTLPIIINVGCFQSGNLPLP
jgi:hypothetical protein